jgi:hypothetical protein
MITFSLWSRGIPVQIKTGNFDYALQLLWFPRINLQLIHSCALHWVVHWDFWVPKQVAKGHSSCLWWRWRLIINHKQTRCSNITLYLNLVLCNYMENWYNCDIGSFFFGGGGAEGRRTCTWMYECTHKSQHHWQLQAINFWKNWIPFFFIFFIYFLFFFKKCHNILPFSQENSSVGPKLKITLPGLCLQICLSVL